jgi:hypothetical protein
VPGGAFVAGALIAMAGMHPDNSDHNLVMSHLCSARSQIWNAALQPKAPGVGLEAYAKHANVLELYEFEPIHSVPTGDSWPIFVALLSIGLLILKRNPGKHQR